MSFHSNIYKYLLNDIMKQNAKCVLGTKHLFNSDCLFKESQMKMFARLIKQNSICVATNLQL